jgi:hypothetical protein
MVPLQCVTAAKAVNIGVNVDHTGPDTDNKRRRGGKP